MVLGVYCVKIISTDKATDSFVYLMNNALAISTVFNSFLEYLTETWLEENIEIYL